jgi:hypothetical protein
MLCLELCEGEAVLQTACDLEVGKSQSKGDFQGEVGRKTLGEN